jgi:hypothetical protein
MNQRTFFLVCSAIFLVIAGAHLSRLILGWDIAINGWLAPHWVSIPGLLIPGLLSAWGFTLAARAKPIT